MEKNINLAKILNGKPVNTKLWSPLFPGVPEKFGFRRFSISYKQAFSDLRFICGFFVFNRSIMVFFE